MAPIPKPPPPLTYDQWLAAGKPPLMFHKSRLAEWIQPSITKQRVHQLFDKETIIHIDGMFDTTHPVNVEWLTAREGAPPPPKPPGRSHAVRAAGGSAGETYDHYGSRGLVRPVGDGDPTGPADLAGFDLEVILEAIENMDLTKLPAAQVDKVRKMEVAFKTRTERMQKRGQLIDRSLVATLLGKLWTIHTNQIRTLGARLAPEVAGRFGVEDPESVLNVEKHIDDEVLKSLKHIQREVDDFLAGVGAA